MAAEKSSATGVGEDGAMEYGGVGVAVKVDEEREERRALKVDDVHAGWQLDCTHDDDRPSRINMSPV